MCWGRETLVESEIILIRRNGTDRKNEFALTRSVIACIYFKISAIIVSIIDSVWQSEWIQKCGNIVIIFRCGQSNDHDQNIKQINSLFILPS